MKFSQYNLSKWINETVNVKKICEQLTYSGLEVEEIQNIHCNYANVVIGLIINISKHPNSHLNMIFKINIGNKIIHVVSKKKIQANTKVVVALPGAVLFDHKIIQIIFVHGIVSEGLICSYYNLNFLNNEHSYIHILNSAPLGINIKDYEFYIDKIIKVNITPNRTDAFGILGIARDISIINDLPKNVYLNSNFPIDNNYQCNLKIQLDNIIYNCSCRMIQGINLHSRTPSWITENLRKCSIRPVNVIIDIINYVFIELGQSLYILNPDDKYNSFNIRFAKKQELIQINKIDIALKQSNIIISDTNRNLSVIGNLNFNNYFENLNSNRIFIGAFFIDPKVVNCSSYQLSNNKIFFNHEYYVDPQLHIQAINYATHLLILICGGCAGHLVNYQSQEYFFYINRKIQVFYKNINNIIGISIDSHVIVKILKKLGYLIYLNVNFFYVTPPSWRTDILIEEDVISDFLRIYRYDKVPAIPLKNTHEFLSIDRKYCILKRVKYTLIDRGYHEAINYSFINSKLQSLFYPKEQLLSLINPISPEMNCMRHSLWPGLIKLLIYHQNRQYEEIKFFESGLCFSSNTKQRLLVDQNLYFSGIIGNVCHKKHWDIKSKNFDFYDLKGDIEIAFDSIGYLENVKFKRNNIVGLHPGQSVSIILHDEVIGHMGVLHPLIAKQLNINYSTLLFELFWYKISYKNQITVNKVSDFPYSTRDISILVNKDILVNNIIEFLKNQFLDNMVGVQLIDIYNNSFIQDNKKSITLKLIFQSNTRTLKDIEVDNMINTCLALLNKKFKIILRS